MKYEEKKVTEHRKERKKEKGVKENIEHQILKKFL